MYEFLSALNIVLLTVRKDKFNSFCRTICCHGARSLLLPTALYSRDGIAKNHQSLWTDIYVFFLEGGPLNTLSKKDMVKQVSSSSVSLPCRALESWTHLARWPRKAVKAHVFRSLWQRPGPQKRGQNRSSAGSRHGPSQTTPSLPI